MKVTEGLLHELGFIECKNTVNKTYYHDVDIWIQVEEPRTENLSSQYFIDDLTLRSLVDAMLNAKDEAWHLQMYEQERLASHYE